MNDSDKTKSELIKELRELRQHLENNKINDVSASLNNDQLHESETAFNQLMSFNEVNYSSIFYHSSIAMTLADRQGKYIRVNQAATKITGYSEKEMLEKNICDLVFPDEIEKVQKTIDLLIAGKKSSITIEKKCIHKSGKTIWGILTVTPLKNKDGVVNYLLGHMQDITELKRIEHELRSSEEKFRKYIEDAPVGIFVADSQGYYTMVNNEACRMSGYSEDELIGMSLTRLISPNNSPDVYEVFPKLKKKGKCQNEFALLKKDGSDIYVSLKALALSQDRFIAFCSDVSTLKKVEKELKKSEEYKQTVMDNLPIGIAVNTTAPPIKFSYMNDLFPKIYRTSQEALKEPDAFWKAVYHNPEFREKIKSRVLEDCLTGDKEQMHWKDIPLEREGEETRYITAMNIPLVEQNLMISTVWDVTEQKKTEKELELRQYYLTKAQEIGIIGTWDLNIEENILQWTEENYKIFEVPRSTPLTYEIFVECVHPDDRKYVNDEWTAAILGKPYDIVHRLLVNNRVKWVREKADVEFNQDGIGFHAIGVTQDITSHKAAEEMIHLRERQYHELIQSVSESILLLDVNGQIIFLNPSAASLLDEKLENVQGKNLNKLEKSTFLNICRELFRKTIITRKSHSMEYEIPDKDNNRWYIVKTQPMNNEAGIQSVLIITFDHTDSKLAEIHQNELTKITEKTAKLASIGVISAGITHEINQPLNAMQLSADSVKIWADKNESNLPAFVIRLLAEISSGVKRISKIIEHMRNYWVDYGDNHHEINDLNVAVYNSITFLQSQISNHGIDLVMDFSEEELNLRADKLQIEQIANNLISNAVLALDQSDSEAKKLIVRTGGNDKTVFLEVIDNGPGIPENKIDKIFDPFFSTRKPGEGMGLGLAIVKMFTERFKGNIEVGNSESGGAKFRVEFPAAN